MVRKQVVVGGFIIVWAVALQGHMMWLKRQEAFKQKFGELQSEVTAPMAEIQAEDQKAQMATEKALHRGGCHCKRIRWQVKAPSEVVCWDCNCSNCAMRQNLHFIVPSNDFELEEGSQQWLTEYTFGTHQAKHLFCKVCGICSYYIPRSNPDGIAVTVHCIDPGSIKSTEVKKFDGQNWGEAYRASTISACSER